jgi:hypothetical protein
MIPTSPDMKVLLVQIAVPSRTDVPEYQKLRSMVSSVCTLLFFLGDGSDCFGSMSGVKAK